ncbi:MAG TPA: bromodomain-containing protein [Coleofasciculaceae cyanobacterium]
MSLKYRWKDGEPPSRDEAAVSEQLLDESQFDSEHDHQVAEDTARKHLNVPTRVPDDDRPVLPQGDAADDDSSTQADINKP